MERIKTVDIKPFEIEYECWFPGAYLLSRKIRIFYCYTDDFNEAIKMFDEFKRPYTMFGEMYFSIRKHS